jgi:integrase
MGYIRVVGSGPKRVSTYIIRKRIGGLQFEVSTRRNFADAAVKEYRRFEDDPQGYEPLSKAPAAEAGPQAVTLTQALQNAYLKHCAKTLENTNDWYKKKQRLLEWWAEELRDVDLRTLDLETHVLTKVKNRTSRAHALAVFKHFIAWMRDAEVGPEKDKRLVGEEGRAFLEWKPKSAKKAKQETVARWFTHQNWLQVRQHLRPWMQDAGDVLAATGWHSSELRAFVKRTKGAGLIEDPPGGTALPGTNIAVVAGQQVEADKSKVLVTRHKGGHTHKTRVASEVATIAARLQEGGTLDLNRFTNQLAWLCRRKTKAEVEKYKAEGKLVPFREGVSPAVTPGAFRHSVATWMFNSGTPLPVISTFLGHMSPSTTKKFYATLGVAENPMLAVMQKVVPAAVPAATNKAQPSP